MSAGIELENPLINFTGKVHLKRWHVLYTKPRAEKKVSLRLAEKGIEHYLPLVKTLKQWSDRKKVVIEPAFKSYVFVNILTAQKADVLNTEGITKFVSFSSENATIPARQIEDLKRIFEQQAFEFSICDQLVEGDEVEIVAGSLAGIKGTLIKKTNSLYFVLNITLLNQSILVKIPENFIKKTSK